MVDSKQSTVAVSGRVPKELKERFETFCAANDTTPSKMLGLMIGKVCALPTENIERDTKTKPDAPAENKPIFLRLSSRDSQELKRLAKLDKITAQDWIRKRIRASLWRTPQFSKSEEVVLLQSNRELSYLGRNINQIAHQMNSSLNAMDLMTAKKLEILSKEIELHRSRVYSMINENWGRYGDGEKLDG